MKLTVGRIVNAHHLTYHAGMANESGPWAALVTHITAQYARLRIFWAHPDYDLAEEVSLDADTIIKGCNDWLWRWPPREL